MPVFLTLPVLKAERHFITLVFWSLLIPACKNPLCISLPSLPVASCWQLEMGCARAFMPWQSANYKSWLLHAQQLAVIYYHSIVITLKQWLSFQGSSVVIQVERAFINFSNPLSTVRPKSRDVFQETFGYAGYPLWILGDTR